MTVRPATPDDHFGVRRVIDASLLSVASLDDQIAETLVAVPDDRSTVLGAIVLDPDEAPGAAVESDCLLSTVSSDRAHIVAIAVRRSRRGQGIGTALVRAAAERYPVLTAAFDYDVRPFYRSLGFDVRQHDGEDDRLWGVLETSDCDDA